MRSTESFKQSRRLLECIENNFLIHVIQPDQKNIVSPVLANLQELITEVKAGGSLGCSDHALTMKIVRELEKLF